MAVIDIENVHPGVENLRQLAHGRLPADEVAALEEHLAACANCCLLLEETPEDSFVGRLRQARSLAAADTLFNSAALTLSSEGAEPGELTDHPRYRLIRLLGRGGMGAVYLAEHRHMARPVALKVINSDLLNQRGSVPRFQQEARTAAKLDHPNIVAAYDADQAGDLHFLVMEHVEGQNLADYVSARGPLPVTQACDIIRQAAGGLQHAHERGMVHRDIKPHNLMLTPSGQVKVLDFGLALLKDDGCMMMDENASDSSFVPSTSLRLTGAGAVMGSADYIAPEQARDARAADCRSDIYSLGCTLYYLLTQRPPFPDGTAPEKLHRHGADDPCRLTALRPEVPNELVKVVAKMMAKCPEDRYQSAAEVATALMPFTVSAIRKPLAFRTKVVGAAVLSMALFALAAAAGVVRLSAGDREIVIETDDPKVEIVVKGDRIVRIVDPKTGKAYQLDRNDLTLSLADDPDGLAVMLDGERPLTLKRQGERIATVRVVAQKKHMQSGLTPAGTLPVEFYMPPPLKSPEEPLSDPRAVETSSLSPTKGYPAEMIITLTEVEVRSGPTAEYYATSKLRAGDRVLVSRESDEPKGWLAIKPPEGSFSWINQKHIKQIDSHSGVVTVDGAKIRTGSSVSNKTPDVEAPFKIPLGAVVTILDKGKTADGVTWIPIRSWHLEVRFIPGEAVQARHPANTSRINEPIEKIDVMPPVPPEGAAPAPSWNGERWSVRSVLRGVIAKHGGAHPVEDGQPVYVLEDSKGKALMLAGCEKGTTLRNYVDKRVALYGAVSMKDCDGVPTQFMKASHVAVFDSEPVPKKAADSPAHSDRLQVQLEVTMARIEIAEAKKLTARWMEVMKNDGGDQPSGVSTPTRPLFGVLNDRAGLLKDLSALSAKNLAKVSSESRTRTSSGRPAWIVSGGEVPIITSSGKGATKVSYKVFGTKVNMLPTILPNFRIQLEVRPEISDLYSTMGLNIEGPEPTSVPGFRTQSAEATVQMQQGQTLVIGGLLLKRSDESEQELIILVTPRLIHAAAPETIREVRGLDEHTNEAIPPPPRVGN